MKMIMNTLWEAGKFEKKHIKSISQEAQSLKERVNRK